MSPRGRNRMRYDAKTALGGSRSTWLSPTEPARETTMSPLLRRYFRRSTGSSLQKGTFAHSTAFVERSLVRSNLSPGGVFRAEVVHPYCGFVVTLPRRVVIQPSCSD